MKHALVLAAGVALSTLWAASAPAQPPANATSPLGTNLSGLRDWTGEWPFVDAFKTSREWIAGERNGCWDCAGPLDLDANGWVRSLDAGRPNGGQVARTVHFSGGPVYPGGRYTVVHQGEGQLLFGGSASVVSSTPGRYEVDVNPASGLFIMTLAATNPANYVRNIRILMPGGACSNDPTRACAAGGDCPGGTCRLFSAGTNADDQLFHPRFLANTKRYKVLRFMDWMDANGSPASEYADYVQLTDAHWHQAPAAIMAELGNRLDADVWVTVLPRSSDDFVRRFATDLRNRLEAGRRVYVEYGNEIWNTAYPFSLQHAFVARRGCETYADIRPACDQDDAPGNGVYCEGHPANRWVEGCATGYRRYYSRRSVQVWDIFAQVFGGTTRLVRVMGSQAANSWLHGQYLSWEEAWRKTDALAIAPYFGGGLGGNTAVPGWTLDQLFQNLQTAELPQALGWVQSARDLLQSDYPSVRLIAYEGGQHLAGLGALQDNAPLNALFDAANRDPRMGQLYTAYLNGWRQRGGQTFAHFVNVSGYSRYGRWGALEYQDQDPATSPKYQALMGFITANPCWWPGCASSTGLRLYTTAPCRLVDTRGPAGPLGGPRLAGGVERSFVVSGVCNVPATARGLVVNVTAVGATHPGHLQLYSTELGAPVSSVVNFQAGRTRANNAVVALGATGSLTARAGVPAGGGVHLVLDVFGYLQ